jgi:transposase
VKRDEQARGMSHLLTLGVRVYTLIEFVVRRSLKNSGEKLSGLHPENRKKETDTPTCERLLKAFSKISLTFIDLGGKVIRHLTPLSELQLNILRHFGADPAIYNNLGKLQI